MPASSDGPGRPGRAAAAPETARGIALTVLTRVEADGAWSNVALRRELAGRRLSPVDRAFATDLVRGTLRWQLALDALLAPVISRPLVQLEPVVRQAMRLGAYQLAQAGVAPHAAVSATVDAIGAHRARGMVNGVLRSLARSGPPWQYPDDPVLLSFPAWSRETVGDTTLRALQERAATHVRLRRGREAEAEARLPPGAVPGRVVDAIRRLDAGGDPEPLVRAGLVTVQDEASAAVGLAARPLRDGVPVVDLAAAPGGKATELAELAPSSPVVAFDNRRGRARLVAAAARRLGLENVHPVVADSRHPPLAPLPAGSALLLDAPCSGLGTLRRRPEIRHRVTPEHVAQLASLQAELALAAAAQVPPGGTLVYSACTLTESETLGVARFLLERLEEDPTELPLAPHPVHGPGPGGFLLPEVHDTDGMYLLRLRRP